MTKIPNILKNIPLVINKIEKVEEMTKAEVNRTCTRGYGRNNMTQLYTCRQCGKLLSGIRELSSHKCVEQLREPLRNFVFRMESRLKANDHKSGWEDSSDNWLLRRLMQEIGELIEALDKNNALNIRNEAADIANFCMMIAYNHEDT